MAISNQQLTILQTMLAGLSLEQKQILGAASTEDISAAAAQLITTQRSESLGQVISALVSGNVSNWTGLEVALEVADGATIYAAVDAFKEALLTHDANAMLVNAVRTAMAARKHLGRP
jgi:hypothetical protein